MTFDEWLATVPEAFKADPLWKMKVYRLALFLADLAWHDATKLAADARTVRVAGQLLEAAGSVGNNIAEGYSRRSGKDRARLYEYALGSARESRGWYFQGRHVLSERVVTHRINLISEIARMLLSIIPRERTRNLAETPADYDTDLSWLLDNPPLP